MRRWRFYDQFRTDRDAPSRRTQVGTRTPILASDGADLPAAIETIMEIGDATGFRTAIADAFAGAEVGVTVDGGLLGLAVRQPGLLRQLGAAELSDGTLRYILLVTALLSPRPPALMVMNEPEASLHADLMAPLARLILAAARRTQVVVVTHAATLSNALTAGGDAVHVALAKRLGETVIEANDRPAWTWPSR